MTTREISGRIWLGVLAIVLASCAAETSSLRVGMTPGQAVEAMGQPDLSDKVPDPAGSGAQVPRYIWLKPGKAAIFGNDRHVAVINDVSGATAKTPAEVRAGPPQEFDPINTPLNYAFYPIRLGFTYLGAGLNCVGGGGCRMPEVPSPSGP